MIIPITTDFSSQKDSFKINISGFNEDSLYHSGALGALAINDFFSTTSLRSNQKCDLHNLIHPFLIYKSANLVL